MSVSQVDSVRVSVDLQNTFAEVNPGMYGIFFEEINQAGEGGLYAELLRTPGMEDGAADKLPSGWKSLESTDAGSVRMDATSPLNQARRHSLLIQRTGPGDLSAINEGFWGIPLSNGGRYRFTAWIRSDAAGDVRLGDSRATAGLPNTRGSWRRVQLSLAAPADTSNGDLRISPKQNGSLWTAYASLMPERPWKNRANGLRPDLAERINALRPGFVRLPGGCYIEGHDLAQAYDWKKSIGPVEERVPMPRTFWGYPASNGLGFHEYLQWCEDLGAPALFVANCGMSHTQNASGAAMDRYVRDVLDAIEYANGPTDSEWGRLRSKNGHAKPFNLRFIQIGNENGGPAYNERYALMAKAIKGRYPDIQLIANVWGGVPTSYPLEIIDEHYYSNPAFFWRNSSRYDSYDRKGPKIYVGEYAVTRGCGQGNLAAALSEAAFITGMERNADIVRMASYAPLFANVNNRQWNPNAIVFDNSRSTGTPSYWVQWLFANHRPDSILSHQVDVPKAEPPQAFGQVGIQTWRTQAEFKAISLQVDGKTVFESRDLEREQFEFVRGDWSVAEGLLKQSSRQQDLRTYLKGVQVPEDSRSVRLSLKARKTGGDEGFIIMLGVNPATEFQWNLGGWNNTVHAFQRDGERTGRGVAGKIETGRWYDITLEREGATTRAYLDGNLMETHTEAAVPDFAAVAGLDKKKNEIVLKLVNGSASPRLVRLDFSGGKPSDSASGFVMQSNSLGDENSLDQPDRIRPQPFRVTLKDMSHTAPPYSVTVLRLRR